MPDIFVVIGDANSRKSYTIRALTGAYNKGFYDIGLQNNNILNVYVHISSLQESRISPQQFVTDLNTVGYSYVLVSLWIRSGHGQPDGLTYLNAFISAGWNVQDIVVLGTPQLPYALPTSVPTPAFIPNSVGLPANNIASQIRGTWNWL